MPPIVTPCCGPFYLQPYQIAAHNLPFSWGQWPQLKAHFLRSACLKIWPNFISKISLVRRLPITLCPSSSMVSPRLKDEHHQFLQRPFTKEEVKNALFDMAPFKSPGIDGLHAGFFQNFLHILGDYLCEYALQFFNTGTLPKGSNDTGDFNPQGE